MTCLPATPNYVVGPWTVDLAHSDIGLATSSIVARAAAGAGPSAQVFIVTILTGSSGRSVI